MKPVIVTGGAGFIGSNLVRSLAESHHYFPIVIDKMTYAGNLDSIRDLRDSGSCEFHRLAIEDTAVRSLLADKKPHAIFNLAAETHVDRSIAEPSQFVQTNVTATHQFLEYVREFTDRLDQESYRQFRMIHMSTDEVYGSLQAGDSPFSEQSPILPNSPYAASKAAGEHFVRAYQNTYGLRAIIIRCSNNYGPRQFPEKLIPLWITRALQSQSMPIYGTGSNVRDWIYVEDHCRALLSILENGTVGDVYNIGANQEQSNLQVFAQLSEVIAQADAGGTKEHVEGLLEHVQDRPGHDFRYAIDASKLREELGWEPQETFQSGLRATVAWYVENSDWLQRIRSGAHRYNPLAEGQAQ